MSTRLKRVALHTLGCKLNYAETDTLAQRFEEAGYETIAFNEPADVYVINSCSVTENADTECRQLVRRVKKINPESKVVVTGCYAELKPERLKTISGIDLVIGNRNKFNVVSQVERHAHNEAIQNESVLGPISFQPSYSYASRTRSFLKVQDGCDYNCTFCTIPLARGLSRSASIADVLKQVDTLAQKGVKEIVLTGINLGDFGFGPARDVSMRKTEHFLDLLKALDNCSNIVRFRVSSVEPNLMSDAIIKFIAHSQRFAPHVHMPLQSGSDEILKRMKRRYKSDLYRERVAAIKSLMPHAAIGCDVIVGFPGEHSGYFNETEGLLKELEVSYLHVFSYSERVNTPATALEGKVSVQECRIRSNQLRKLSELKLQQFSAAFHLSQRPVLWEQPHNGKIRGYTDNYIRVQSVNHLNAAGEMQPTTLFWDYEQKAMWALE